MKGLGPREGKLEIRDMTSFLPQGLGERIRGCKFGETMSDRSTLQGLGGIPQAPTPLALYTFIYLPTIAPKP